MPLEAILYARVSPRRIRNKDKDKPQPEPEIQIESIDTQLSFCRKAVEARGFPVLTELADKLISGKDMKTRPNFQIAFKMACERKAVLVVYSLSRLSRSLKDAIEISQKLEAAGAQLMIVRESFDTTTANGRLFFNIIASINQFQREVGAEITSEAMQRQQSDGRIVSRHLPWGYKRDKSNPEEMVESEYEQHLAEIIRDMRKRGQTPHRIAKRLTKLGLFGRSKTWHVSTIRKIAKSA